MFSSIRSNLLVSCLILGFAGHSQKSSIAPVGGGIIYHKQLFFSQTIGQASLTSGFQNGSVGLLQGFEYLLPARSSDLVGGLPNITVYPNPSDGRVTIGWKEEKKNEIVLLKIFEQNGSQVLGKDLDRVGSIVHADLSELHDGIYLLQVWNGNSVFWNNLIIQH